MSKPTIQVKIERQKKVAAIVRQRLTPYGLQNEIDEKELNAGKLYVAESIGNKERLSKAVLNAMFPHEPAPSTLYHYTSLDGLKGIASSGELRLYPIRKRLGEGGELEAFASAHGLKGYLDSAQGEAFFKELSDDLFYTSMTRVPPKDPSLMWYAFAHGNGARLELRVQPKAAQLRPIRYEQYGSRTLLQEINEALSQQGEPPFLPWTLSQIGAFYLSSSVETEDEVRLLIKRYSGGLDLTRNDGAYDYWPVPIAADNNVCRIDLLGIHVAPSGTKKDIEAAISGTKFAAIPVAGP